MIIQEDREVMQKLCGQKLTDEEVLEARENLLGAFKWLLKMDQKYHPELYKNNLG